MKNKILFSVIPFLICFSLAANTFDNFLENNFQEGKKAFFSTFFQNINYPLDARLNGVMGQLQTKLTIREDGSIDRIEFLNELGYGIESEVKRVLLLTDKKWKTSEEERTLDFTIAFQLGEDKVIEADLKVVAMGSPRPSSYFSAGPLKTNKQLEKSAKKLIKKQKYKEAMEVCEELLIRTPDSEKYKTIQKEIKAKLEEK